MVFGFIRRMSNARKEKVRSRLAIAYAIIAWNGFAICLYTFIKKTKQDSGLPSGLYEAALTESTKNTKVIRFEGLTLVENRNYGEAEIEEARAQLKSKCKNKSNPTDESDDF